ncbi:hypothetical protein SAMN05444422_11582 [Halobiforma haloterrestris]|uniref:Uncharacterized protein n=1 Tax=Natronobacterium haloterrestre TaxID=148448 RepID=A0A1I1LM65_NATHA|nr:hypothetical protein SAMN05444422_11582 [Halobiforma haloterrestris]
MEENTETSDFLAACDSCGTVFAATITADDRVLPIGARDGCRCGGTSFSRIDEEDFEDPSDTA